MVNIVKFGKFEYDENPAVPSLLTKRIEYDGEGNPIYVGYAKAGTGEDYAGWCIIKLVYDTYGNLTAVLFAGGSADFDKKWSERASYDYL